MNCNQNKKLQFSVKADLFENFNKFSGNIQNIDPKLVFSNWVKKDFKNKTIRLWSWWINFFLVFCVIKIVANARKNSINEYLLCHPNDNLPLSLCHPNDNVPCPKNSASNDIFLCYDYISTLRKNHN